jgi:Fic family protein
MVVFNPVQASNAVGDTLRIGRGDAAYYAFVPRPLPPALELDATLFTALSEADRALGELAGLGRMLPNPNLLINPFVHKEAVLSSKIEGTQATIIQLYEVEAEVEAAGRRRPNEDVEEVINYIDALYFGLQRIEELPMSGRLIRELHERLMAGVRGQERSPGEFRTSQNWIGPPGCTLNEARYVPPPVAEMKEALNEFERYLHSPDINLPPLIRLAAIHCQFEMIHPFLDGNGRIGRLLITILLVHWNLLPLPLLYLSAFFERERATYYDRLLGASRDGRWGDWIEFFLRGVAEQSRDAIARAKRLQDLQQRWRQEVTHARTSALLLRLIDSLFETPVLTIPRAASILGVTYPAAKGNVSKLADAGILQPFGDDQSYGRRYWAPEVLTAIEE